MNAGEKPVLDDAAPRRFRRLMLFAPYSALLALIVLHFVYLMGFFEPAICSPDANGYWAQATLLFDTGRTCFVPESDLQYVGVHWLLTDSGKYFSRYPPGLPFIVGVVYWLFGWKASIMVNPVLASLSLLGLFLVVRQILGPWWGVAGAAALSVNPVLNQHSIACDSHVAVTFFLVWGIFFLLCWSEGGGILCLLPAGFFLGFIPTIRYPEALFGLGCAVFILWEFRHKRDLWKHCAVAVAGAAIPIMPLLVRNHLAFGAFYRTGYALTNEQTGFGVDYLIRHYDDYIVNLVGDGVGLFFGLGLAGLAVMLPVPRLRRTAVLFLLLILPSTLLYMSYYWDSGRMADGTLRFLLPTFTVYVVAALFLLDKVLREHHWCLRGAAVSALLLLNLVWGLSNSMQHLERLKDQKKTLAIVTAEIEDNAKPGDVFISSNELLQHLDFIRRWRLVETSALRPPRANGARDDEDEDEPSPRQKAKDALRAEKFSGMTPPEQERRIARSLLEWAGDNDVFFIGSERQLGMMRGLCFNRGAFEIVDKIAIPETMGASSGRDGAGRPGAGPGGGADGRPFLKQGMGRPDGRHGMPPGIGSFAGEKEIVVAKWKKPDAK